MDRGYGENMTMGGSTSSRSINAVLRGMRATSWWGTKRHLDLRQFELPMYSVDEEQANGVPRLAVCGRGRAVDAVIVALAEHNGSYAAAFKNIDWATRHKLEGLVGEADAAVEHCLVGVVAMVLPRRARSPLVQRSWRVLRCCHSAF